MATCCLCKEETQQILFYKDFIKYYKCTGCDFVFSCPENNPNFENTLDDYEPAYLAYLDESTEDEKNFDLLWQWVLQFTPLEEKKVLDVGAGSGKLVRFLRKRNIESFGIEPAAPLFENFLYQEDYFFQETIEAFSLKLPFGGADVVFACDVLEHVSRPDIFFDHLAKALKPGGFLFVTTPDVESMFAHICGRNWHFYNKYHLSYFSRKTITTTAQQYGLIAVDFCKLSRIKSIGYLLNYIIDFVIRDRRNVKIPDWLNNIFFPIKTNDVMYVVFEKRQLS
ncbi:MAG: class I SAM-dependent methyltransferase [Pseudomonadota bacterium]